eukprot:870577_1
MSSYFTTATILILIQCNSLTKIYDTWIDDYSCDAQQWSNCEGYLIYHGPYSSNLDTLSRSFECQHDSHLNILFYAKANCLFDTDDTLRVCINNDCKHHIHIPTASELVQNDSVCDDQWVDQSLNVSRIPIKSSTSFKLTFGVDSVFGSILLSDIQISCIPVYVPDRSNSVLFGLSWSSLAAIVYFSLYTLLLFCIAIYVAIKKEYDGIKKFFKTIFKMRKIYGSVLVHLYDTATDVGVMIDWWFLAQDEKRGYNYESIDMANLFWASVGFLTLYRIVGIIMVLMSEDRDDPRTYSFCAFLAVFDMYIIRTVWVAIENGEEEPHPKQRLVQLMESLCESLPQILLQTVFIIRGYNNQSLKESSSVTLVVLSLAASVLSITNKFVWIDRPVYTEYWRDPRTKSGGGCPFGINYRWILRILYRFSMIFVRFVGLSLIWVILGGAFLPMYIVFSWVYWLLLTGMSERSQTLIFANGKIHRTFTYCDFSYLRDNPKYWITVTSIALVSNAQNDGFGIQIGRFIEHILLLSVVTVFAFVDDIKCGICADSATRQAHSNQYISIFLVCGWAMFVIETTIGAYIVDTKATSGDADDAFRQIVNAFGA